MNLTQPSWPRIGGGGRCSCSRDVIPVWQSAILRFAMKTTSYRRLNFQPSEYAKLNFEVCHENKGLQPAEFSAR
jgi:hypothetical protein